MSAGAFRALFIVIVACAFNLLTTNIHAQNEPAQDERVLDGQATEGIQDGSQVETATEPRVLAVDPITAAEWDNFWDNNTTGTTTSTSTSSVWGIVRVLLTLALAAAAIYGLVYLIKRFTKGNAAKDPFLKVLSSVPLGTNRSAHIISVGSQAWLVGAAENGVNLISEIEDNDLLNAMLLEDSRKSATASLDAGHLPDFKALLQKLGMKVGGKAPGTEDIRKRSEKLKGL